MFRVSTMYQTLNYFTQWHITYVPHHRGGDVIPTLTEEEVRARRPPVTWLLNDHVGMRSQSV